MNLPIRVTLLAVALGYNANAMADARLQAEILPVSDGRGTSIELKLVNVGDRAALMWGPSLPQPNARGMLLDDFFVVTQPDGGEAEYVGILSDTLPVAPTLVPLPAGGTFRVQVALDRSYRLAPGAGYRVALRTPVGYRSNEATDGSWIPVSPVSLLIVVPKGTPGTR